MSGGCGAEVSGLSLSEPMDKAEKKLLEKAWLEYQVLFFRDQPLTPEQHVNFAKNFGELQGPGYMPTLARLPQRLRPRIPRPIQRHCVRCGLAHRCLVSLRNLSKGLFCMPSMFLQLEATPPGSICMRLTIHCLNQ